MNRQDNRDVPDDGPPKEPYPVWKYEKGQPPGQDFMTMRSPRLLMGAMIVVGVVGVAGFIMGVTKFAATGEGGALGFGLFMLISFGLLSFFGIRIAAKRLRWKRAHDEYTRTHPGPHQQ